ncbi:TerB N-terminal domain-containing protein [Paenibacillus sp. sgz500958]|uniref:TerB N-terminal domain-containing protein n=1 Tax=Paenibacillus sp. sgz500958 TaxID=3242475 RepID=UPI0036D3FDB2
MGNDRSQPHFTELIFESTEKNMAIPPRDSTERSLPKQTSPEPDLKKKEPMVQLQLWDTDIQEPVTTTEGQFVARARELVNHKEPAALFVPFKSYWPTYGHMTGPQYRWYFYWRDEVRHNRFHKTDLSYIFLHVYELINGVGWEDPLDGYRQLCAIWEAYRDSFKRFDQYLGGWIADFSFVHKLDVPLSLIVARSRGLAGDLAELELMRCLTSSPDELSFTALTVMSDYDISKSKFYIGEGKEAIELYVPQVVALINAYVIRKHGMNLVEMFPPGPAVLRERYLFRSAVYDISLYGYSVLVPVVRISKSPPLRNLITRLFRLTENKIRERMGFRGRLKGVNVDADMDELITRYLQREFRKKEQEDKGPAVVINQEKLERLQSDSEIVRSLLTMEGELPVEETQGWILHDAVSDEIAAVPEDSVKREPVEIVNSTNTPEELIIPVAGESNSGWELFAASLSPLQKNAVLALANDNGMAALSKLATGSGTMPELLIDEINELAMETLGDLLIDMEEIMEEYVPMVQYLMR